MHTKLHMHTKLQIKALCAALLTLVLTSTAFADPPSVRFSEIHYDNTGTDVGESIEVSGPAGTDVTGWRVILYNGNGGASYSTQTLTGTIPATCSARGVLVLNYPSNGIQNGGTTATGVDSPDGFALVDAAGTVIEYLSYEGAFAAVDGPAVALTSTDIGSRELGNEPAGLSLARNSAGIWSTAAANSFGTCNDDGVVIPPADVASVTVTPITATILQGATQAFSASAFDATSQPIAGTTFTWTSSAPTVATVNASGVATGVAPGDAIISATAANGVANTAALHVNPSTPPVDVPNLHFTEIHYDNVGTDANEAIEVEGPAGADLTGYSIVLYDGNGGASYSTQLLSGIIPATCGARGVMVINYPVNGIQNGGPDGFALVNAANQVVQFLSYEGAFPATTGPAAGLASTDIGAAENSPAIGLSLQRDSTNVWRLTTSSFGACNVDGPPAGGNRVILSGRSISDPPLPVGFQAQVFATVRDAANQVVPTTITWTSDSPAIASIDQNGVFTALAEGTAILRATAADGVTTATTSLPTRIGVASTTAIYTGNTEFGEPQDSDASDDFIVRYPQYTASYNVNRGTPNWVSYVLDLTDYGPEDRCNCFTTDPALPASFPRLTTADYTGAGDFAGYGIDRGHMARSFDRTAGSLDNAVTYYFTNVAPQAADLNQGPWAIMENELGDLARFQNKEVFVVVGVAGNKGTLKNEGKIVIPTSTWKVAVVLTRGQHLADIHTLSDLQVIAVNMPNEPGVRNIPWQTYQTTVREIEQLTGYDLLELLPDNIERAVETNTQPPTASVSAPASTMEGASIAISGAGSSDTNGTVANYAWDFGDGTTANGQDVEHIYAQDGVFTVSLTVTDNDGLTDTTTVVVTVTNVTPTVDAFAGATLNVGQSYTAAGTFSDPGNDAWTATVDWGDGTTSQGSLSARSFSFAHTYTTPGIFTVTVQITDDDGTSSRTQSVTVNSSTQGITDAKTLIDQWVAAKKISRSMGSLINAELTLAERELARGRTGTAKLLLQAAILDVKVLALFGVITAADAQQLIALVTSAIGSI